LGPPKLPYDSPRTYPESLVTKRTKMTAIYTNTNGSGELVALFVKPEAARQYAPVIERASGGFVLLPVFIDDIHVNQSKGP
jgi:hypothetical protein